MTYNTAMVLLSLGAGESHGFDIAALLGLSSGTIYPILRKLEGLGLVRSEWEDEADAHSEGRPRRRYYELTPAGIAARDEAIGVFQRHEQTFASLLARTHGK